MEDAAVKQTRVRIFPEFLWWVLGVPALGLAMTTGLFLSLWLVGGTMELGLKYLPGFWGTAAFFVFVFSFSPGPVMFAASRMIPRWSYRKTIVAVTVSAFAVFWFPVPYPVMLHFGRDEFLYVWAVYAAVGSIGYESGELWDAWRKHDEPHG